MLMNTSGNIMDKKPYRFGIVSKDVLTDQELSLRAKAVYSILCTYANKERTCFPLIATIADTASVHPNTIKRAIKELKEKNYIRREGRLIRLT